MPESRERSSGINADVSEDLGRKSELGINSNNSSQSKSSNPRTSNKNEKDNALEWTHQNVINPFLQSSVIEPYKAVKSIVDSKKESSKSSFLPEIDLTPSDNLPMNSPTYWARNISSGLGAAIVYAVAGKIAGAGLRGAASRLGIAGQAAELCASEHTAQIAGSALWDFARKPNQGETRLSNSISGGASFLFFELGNSRLKTVTGNPLLSVAGHIAIGAGGGVVQHFTSDALNGRLSTKDSLIQTAINGGAMNVILPHTQRLIGHGIDAANLHLGRGVPIQRLDAHIQEFTHSSSPTLSQLVKENPLARLQLQKPADARADSSLTSDVSVSHSSGKVELQSSNSHTEDMAKLGHELQHLSSQRANEQKYQAIADLLKDGKTEAAWQQFRQVRADEEHTSLHAESKITDELGRQAGKNTESNSTDGNTIDFSPIEKTFATQNTTYLQMWKQEFEQFKQSDGKFRPEIDYAPKANRKQPSVKQALEEDGLVLDFRSGKIEETNYYSNSIFMQAARAKSWQELQKTVVNLEPEQQFICERVFGYENLVTESGIANLKREWEQRQNQERPIADLTHELSALVSTSTAKTFDLNGENLHYANVQPGRVEKFTTLWTSIAEPRYSFFESSENFTPEAVAAITNTPLAELPLVAQKELARLGYKYDPNTKDLNDVLKALPALQENVHLPLTIAKQIGELPEKWKREAAGIVWEELESSSSSDLSTKQTTELFSEKFNKLVEQGEEETVRKSKYIERQIEYIHGKHLSSEDSAHLAEALIYAGNERWQILKEVDISSFSQNLSKLEEQTGYSQPFESLAVALHFGENSQRWLDSVAGKSGQVNSDLQIRTKESIGGLGELLLKYKDQPATDLASVAKLYYQLPSEMRQKPFSELLNLSKFVPAEDLPVAVKSGYFTLEPWQKLANNKAWDDRFQGEIKDRSETFNTYRDQYLSMGEDKFLQLLLRAGDGRNVVKALFDKDQSDSVQALADAVSNHVPRPRNEQQASQLFHYLKEIDLSDFEQKLSHVKATGQNYKVGQSALALTLLQPHDLWLASSAAKDPTILENLPIAPSKELSKLRDWLTANTNKPDASIREILKHYPDLGDKLAQTSFAELGRLASVMPDRRFSRQLFFAAEPWQQLAMKLSGDSVKKYEELISKGPEGVLPKASKIADAVQAQNGALTPQEGRRISDLSNSWSVGDSRTRTKILEALRQVDIATLDKIDPSKTNTARALKIANLYLGETPPLLSELTSKSLRQLDLLPIAPQKELLLSMKWLKQNSDRSLDELSKVMPLFNKMPEKFATLNFLEMNRLDGFFPQGHLRQEFTDQHLNRWLELPLWQKLAYRSAWEDSRDPAKLEPIFQAKIAEGEAEFHLRNANLANLLQLTHGPLEPNQSERLSHGLYQTWQSGDRRQFVQAIRALDLSTIDLVSGKNDIPTKLKVELLKRAESGNGQFSDNDFKRAALIAPFAPPENLIGLTDFIRRNTVAPDHARPEDVSLTLEQIAEQWHRIDRTMQTLTAKKLWRQTQLMPDQSFPESLMKDWSQLTDKEKLVVKAAWADGTAKYNPSTNLIKLLQSKELVGREESFENVVRRLNSQPDLPWQHLDARTVAAFTFVNGHPDLVKDASYALEYYAKKSGLDSSQSNRWLSHIDFDLFKRVSQSNEALSLTADSLVATEAFGQSWFNLSKSQQERLQPLLQDITARPELLHDLGQFLFNHTEKPLYELANISSAWGNLIAADRSLPYNELLERSSFPSLKQDNYDHIRKHLVPEARAELDQPMGRLAAHLAARNGINIVDNYLAVLKTGRQSITEKFDKSLVAISSVHSGLPFLQKQLLATTVDRLGRERSGAVEKKESRDLVLNLKTSVYKNQLDRLLGYKLEEKFADTKKPELQRLASDWQPQAAMGLALSFGKQSSRWLDLQIKDGRNLHDASYWLPVEPTRKLAGLDTWLFKFHARPIEELSLVARSWASLSENDRVKSYKEILASARAVKYSAQRDPNFALESATWGVSPATYKRNESRYLASLDTPTPFPLDKRWSSDGTSDSLVGRFIPRSDVRGLYLGHHSDSCQHPDNAGRSAAWYGQEAPNSGFFVVEDPSGTVVAQSWAWVSDNGALVFDNVEAKKLGSRDEAVAKVYQAAANDLAKQYHKVTIGTGGSDLELSRWPASAAVALPSDYSGYTDATDQVLLAENQSIAAKPLEQQKTWVRGALESDRERAEEIAKKVYPTNWQHVSEGDYGLVLESKNKGMIGYAMLDTENREVTDIAVLPQERNKSDALIKSLTNYIKHVGGEWSGEFRESTSYRLLKLYEKRGRVNIISDTISEKMAGEDMHQVKFTVP